MAKDDTFEIEVLPDGTLKSTTDPISAANHANAEAFFRLLSDLTGTKGQRTRRKDAKGHVHNHDHVHEDGHGHSH